MVKVSARFFIATVALIQSTLCLGAFKNNRHLLRRHEDYQTEEQQESCPEEDGRRQIDIAEDDRFSFRLRRNWLPGMAWEYDNKGWCLECEMKGRKSTCCEGDKIVLNHCGKSQRQRFVYEENSPGEGCYQPVSSPHLCFTKSVSHDSVILRKCLTGDFDQIFSGFRPGHAFELKATNDPYICLVAPHDVDSVSFKAGNCIEARATNTTMWEAVYQKGTFNGYIPPTNTCPKTCLNVSQQNKTRFVGQYHPVGTSQSIDQFYQYNAQNKFGYNGEAVTPLDADTSIIFVHQDSMECDLSLVIVHGAKDLKEGQECTPGGALLKIAGNLENCVVQDGRNSPSDSFTYIPDKDETRCDWTWSWQSKCRVRTDGLAHRWDLNERHCLKIRPKKFMGINHWKYVPGQKQNDVPANFDDYVSLDTKQDLEICIDEGKHC